MGKYILFLLLWKGAAPVTPEHYSHIMQEFGDKAACEAVVEKFRTAKGGGWNADGGCFPYASEP